MESRYNTVWHPLSLFKGSRADDFKAVNEWSGDQSRSCCIICIIIVKEIHQLSVQTFLRCWHNSHGWIYKLAVILWWYNCIMYIYILIDPCDRCGRSSWLWRDCSSAEMFREGQMHTVCWLPRGWCECRSDAQAAKDDWTNQIRTRVSQSTAGSAYCLF